MTWQINTKFIIIWWEQWKLTCSSSLLTPNLETPSGTLRYGTCLHVLLIGKDLTYTCTQNEKCCAKHVFWFVWGQFLSDDDKEFSSSAEEQKHQEGPCLHKVKKMALKADLLKSILVHGAPMFQPKYVPQCDEEGYYAPMQCMMDKSKCWCVDRLGNKIKNSRERQTRGKPEELDCSWIESSSHKDACYMYR